MHVFGNEDAVFQHSTAGKGMGRHLNLLDQLCDFQQKCNTKSQSARIIHVLLGKPDGCFKGLRKPLLSVCAGVAELVQHGYG